MVYRVRVRVRLRVRVRVRVRGCLSAYSRLIQLGVTKIIYNPRVTNRRSPHDFRRVCPSSFFRPSPLIPRSLSRAYDLAQLLK